MGFLTGVSVKDMLHAQIVGLMLGGVTGCFVYRLYTKVYTTPSDRFPAPHGHRVYSSAIIFYEESLPTEVLPFALGAIIFSALATTL
jgi:hypothetical protein